MLNFILKRSAVAILLTWAALTVTFLLLQASPGDPADRYISPATPPEVIERIRLNFGLNEPVHIQYLKWFERYLQGDFGISLSRHRPVATIIQEALPATLQLTVITLFLSVVFGATIATIAAMHRGRWLDRVLSNGMLALYCMPGFWLALIFIMILAIKLQWFPVSNRSSLFIQKTGYWNLYVDHLRHMALPVLTMTVAGAAATARFVRESLDTIIHSDFMQLARAKGLSEREAIQRHALRHTMLPIISFIGHNFPFLIGGAFWIETIFAWPGLGRVTYEAIFARDYPIVLAANGLAAVMIIVGNLLADVCYRLADPRIRLS